MFTFINPIAVRQGELADCYFLSSLCSLAKTPSRVQKLFIESDSDEAYTVAVYINGVLKKIILDTFFIYDPLISGSPFSRPYMHQIWVQLLEKAWAKVNGSFTNLEFGEEIEAFEFLTGAPVNCYIHNSTKNTPDQIWGSICHACLRNYPIVCSTKREGGKTNVKKSGLMPFHVYSLLDAKESNAYSQRGSAKRLLYLRDPWQKTLWKGSMQNELKYEFGDIEDPDCFVLTLDDYLEYFKETTICKCEDGYVHSSVVIDGKTEVCYTFEVKNNNKGYISIHQDHFRSHRLDDNRYYYSPIYLILGKVYTGKSRYIISFITTVLNTEYRKIDLSQGKYVIFSGVNWSKSGPRKYTIHMYSEEEVEIKETEYDTNTLIEIASSYATINKKLWKSVSDGLYNFVKIDCDLGFGLRFAKNLSDKNIL